MTNSTFCILYSKLAHIVKLMLHPGQRAVVGQRVLVEGVAPGPDEILPTGRVKNIIPLTVQHRGRSSSGTALPPRRLGRRRVDKRRRGRRRCGRRKMFEDVVAAGKLDDHAAYVVVAVEEEAAVDVHVVEVLLQHQLGRLEGGRVGPEEVGVPGQREDLNIVRVSVLHIYFSSFSQVVLT